MTSRLSRFGATLVAALTVGAVTAQLPPARAADIAVAGVTTVAEFGRSPGSELSLPTDVEVDRAGKLFVVDSGNHRVVVFDSAGSRIAVFGERGIGDGQLESPVGIGLGPTGEVYVADKGNHRLALFSSDGRHHRNIPLKENGEDIDPVDVAVSADGQELYVSSNRSHRVVVFSRTGQYLRGWGGKGSGDGQFSFPGILRLDANGNLRVVDILNQRIQVFRPDGTHLASIGGLGARPGTLFRPKGIAMDPAGRMFVGDSFTGVIQAFGPDGEFAFALGESGAPTVFDTPTGLAIAGTRLYVVRMLAGSVLVLDMTHAQGAESGQ